MLKNLTIFALAILLLYNPAFSQETKKALTEKALMLYRQGKFEKAIEAAEQVIELEKANQFQDTLSYANSLINAARMKEDYIIELQNKAENKNLIARDKFELYEKISQIASELETLLRQALQLNETGGRAQSAQTADVKSELAMLVQKYNPTTKPSIESARGRIDEAEKLLTESLLLNEQVRGNDNDKTLSVVLQTGDFYLRYVNFEKALPFYERYIQTTEKKGGKNYPELMNALRSYASILFTGFQDKESADVIKKLEEITQKKEEAKFNNFNFQLRSKDAVAYASQIVQSFRTEDENFRKRLKLVGKTLTRSNLELSPKLVRVQVKVVIDENGKVVEAVADDKDKKNRARAEQEVSKWFVRPFSYNGVKHKMRGVLTYLEITQLF
ncbi:MAG: hypothetical protein H0X72_18685 [Acidobacteria bacterium]|nr:hypothetical protein [Acidobacteriota bacterium]